MQNLDELNGTKWTGTAELWLDPLGDNAAQSDCTISIKGNVVGYTWSHEGSEHTGSITATPDGADFTDSFHSTDVLTCKSLPGAPGIIQVHGNYGLGSDWGWRIGLCNRTPTGQLVLQMTNIAPWGEEARAVRMVAGLRE